MMKVMTLLESLFICLNVVPQTGDVCESRTGFLLSISRNGRATSSDRGLQGQENGFLLAMSLGSGKMAAIVVYYGATGCVSAPN
jgi:hypothetical protein